MAIILFGKQEMMIKNQVKKLIKEKFPNPDEANVAYFSGENNSVEEVVNECCQYSLGFSSKIVVLENAFYLSSERKKVKLSFTNNFDILLNYLKDENPDCLLVMIVNNDKLQKTNEIVKYVGDNGKIIELKDLSKDDWPVYIAKYFEKKNCKIDKDAINELTLRCNNDVRSFVNEANKLLLYCEDNVTLEDVKKITSKPLEENAFELLNNLLLGNKNKAIAIYRDLRLNSVEPVALISMLTSSLIFYDEVALLNKEGYSQGDITIKLNANPYRVQITLRNLRNLEYIQIKNALKNLYQLDKDIKHSLVDRFYCFELFLLNF